MKYYSWLWDNCALAVNWFGEQRYNKEAKEGKINKNYVGELFNTLIDSEAPLPAAAEKNISSYCFLLYDKYQKK